MKVLVSLEAHFKCCSNNTSSCSSNSSISKTQIKETQFFLASMMFKHYRIITAVNRYYAAITILNASLQAPASFAIIEASAAFRSQRYDQRYDPRGWAIDYINFLLQWQSVNRKHGNVITDNDLWNYFVPDFKAAHVIFKSASH